MCKKRKNRIVTDQRNIRFGELSSILNLLIVIMVVSKGCVNSYEGLLIIHAE